MDSARLKLRRAFSMIELIVVVIILAVMAGAILPRFFGNERRRAENEVRQVRDFFDAVANRFAFSSQGLAVSYNALHKRFELYSLRAKGNAGDFAAARDYLPDQMTLPVSLEEVKLSILTADGLPVDPVKGWIEFSIGSSRPTIVAVLTFGQTDAWRVELPGDESQALLARTDLRDAGSPANSRRRDLDAEGASQSPW